MTASFLAACGIFEGGEGSLHLNEPLPHGTSVAVGQFLGSPHVTGVVRVIRTGTGQFVVRLEGLSITEPLPLFVTATVGGVTGGFQAQLRAASGNQNYGTSQPDNAQWTSAEIRPPGAVTVTTPIATAILQ